MDRFDDRTPLWDYSDNSASDDRLSSADHWDRSRAEEASRAYVAAEDRYYDKRDYRGRPRAEDRYRQARAPRRWSPYHPARYDEAVREAREDRYRERRSGWPSEFGYPPARGYEPYGREYHPGERSFLERAGDEVMSWFGDDDARRRRENDHRGRGPKNYTRSDERIREDVNDRLTEDVWLDASEIDVAVADGEVTLTGTVEDRRAKRHAEDCADSVTGVRHVQNNLRYSPGVVSQRIG